MDFPQLNPADRATVTAAVRSVLEDEDFFGTEFVGNPFADSDEAGEA